MRWSDIQFQPNDRVLRQFAAVWLSVLGCLAVWAAWSGGGPAAVAWGAAALGVGLTGWVRPRFIRWIFVGALIATFPIGWLVSSLLLAIVYYGLFTPLGLLFRLGGRDALRLRRRARESYWTPREQASNTKRYLRQY